MPNVTLREQTQIESQVAAVIRSKLELSKPKLEFYQTGSGRAANLITATLVWAKLFILVIAVFAALASSIRTVQAASEIYTAAGSSPIGVVLAALAFTIAVEGALFALALAEEGERINRISEGQRTPIITVRTVIFSILVRLGLREPDANRSSGGGMKPVMAIAFAFAVIANAYMGFRPLLAAVGDVSLQVFMARLWNASANIQLGFMLDLAGILFPPFMSLAAGHLTARFGAEIALKSQTAIAAFESDFAAWRAMYAQPLNTAEGKQLLEQQIHQRIQSKTEKSQRSGEPNGFLAPQASMNGQNPNL